MITSHQYVFISRNQGNQSLLDTILSRDILMILYGKRTSI